LPQGNFRVAPGQSHSNTRINQRRQVETDNVHLQFETVAVVNHGANNGVLNFAAVKVDADSVTDSEFLAASWFFPG
jgi:hypothetical protein